ncbi:MAG: DNA methyltransferase [Fimbriimonadaceae bacterium]
MPRFRDLMYGQIELPDWIQPFLGMPEFARLREIRLSNVDSYEHKDFAGANRWEHSIGVAYLATVAGQHSRLSRSDQCHLTLAALLHDVGTPPFGHTLEAIVQDLDHEDAASSVLDVALSQDRTNRGTVYAGELPQFTERCRTLSKTIGIAVDPARVVSMINGEGKLGFLVNGTLDLDNADNVTRGAHYLGIDVSKRLGVALAKWLGSQPTRPLDLEASLEPAVVEWLKVRGEYYSAFYECSAEEAGREAYLQFILREALRSGMSRSALITSTDNDILRDISAFCKTQPTPARVELLRAIANYKLLECPTQILEFSVEDSETLDALGERAINWIERELREPGLVPALILKRRRHASQGSSSTLFSTARGKLLIFSINKPKGPRSYSNVDGRRAVKGSVLRFWAASCEQRLRVWIAEKPWESAYQRDKFDVVERLSGWGDWSFGHSRNETLHAYPSTFVHALPRSIIRSLNPPGGTVLDPFCGTGQTGTEALRVGGRAVLSDINEIALLVTRCRFSALSDTQRSNLRKIRPSDVRVNSDLEQRDTLKKWHHAQTFRELASILEFINGIVDPLEHQFLRVCFSAILTACTERKGKQHGWFADNTPLPRGTAEPSYVDPVPLFLHRVERNLSILESFYAWIERRGWSVTDTLGKIEVRRTNMSNARPQDLLPMDGSVNLVVTSPPYLCMSDYTLGQRLSYQWLFPNLMARDFDEEIGARRTRTCPSAALDRYLGFVTRFAELSGAVLAPGGFVGLVIGKPVARAFADGDIYHEYDARMENHGFSRLWSIDRAISWHRNQGYQRLREERVIVYEKER